MGRKRGENFAKTRSARLKRPRPPEEDMIEVDCREMTVDEQLALSGAITEGLAGRAVALEDGTKIVLDTVSGKVPPQEVATMIRGFFSKRKDQGGYSLDVDGDKMVVHTPDPLARSRGRQHPGLPDNVYQCPFCGYVTPYEEVYVVHYRSHGFF